MTRKNQIQTLIFKNQRRLQKLKERKATMGLDTPIHIETEIEDTEKELEELQAELRDLQADDASVAVTSSDVQEEPHRAATVGSAFIATVFASSLLIIALSVDLIRRLVMVKPGLGEWSVGIVLALLSLLIVGSALTLTGRCVFLKDAKQSRRARVLIGISVLWLIALIGIWFMRPAVAGFYNDKGVLTHQTGKGEAQNYYRRALSWDSDNTVALFNLGVIYEEMGKCEQAVGWYERAMESDSAFAPAYNNMARLYISELCPEIQNPKRASNLLETARDRLQKQSVSPEFSTEVNHAVAKNLGWAYLVEKRYVDAERELRAAINLVEERAAAHCLLAQVLEKTATADKEAALREWRDCLAFGPDPTLYEENQWASIARGRLGGQ